MYDPRTGRWVGLPVSEPPQASNIRPRNFRRRRGCISSFVVVFIAAILLVITLTFLVWRNSSFPQGISRSRDQQAALTAIAKIPTLAPIATTGVVIVLPTNTRIPTSTPAPTVTQRPLERIAAGNAVRRTFMSGGANLSRCGYGYVAAEPTYSFYLGNSVRSLQIDFRSQGDTTLLVRGPSGHELCNDDYDGYNPRILIDYPPEGTYHVWVGSYNPNERLSGNLIIQATIQSAQRPEQPAPSHVIPPSNQRATAPRGAVRLNNGIGLTNGRQMNDGNFQVEGYCHRALMDVEHDHTDWFCKNDRIRVRLTVENLDEICRQTYRHSGAFAIQDGREGRIPAFRWRCYAFQ